MTLRAGGCSSDLDDDRAWVRGPWWYDETALFKVGIRC